MRTTVKLLGEESYLRPEVDRLTHNTTIALLPRQGEIAGRHVRLDLRNVAFVEPFGLIYLYLYVQQLLEFGATNVEVRIPRGDVNTYLTRMNVCEQLERDSRVKVRPPRFILTPRDLRSRLIELGQYRVEHEDEVDALTERLLDLIHQRRKIQPALTEPLEFALQEVIGNVAVHSERDQVLVAAQKYGEKIYIAIADTGIGIPGRLRKSKVRSSSDDLYRFGRR